LSHVYRCGWIYQPEADGQGDDDVDGGANDDGYDYLNGGGDDDYYDDDGPHMLHDDDDDQPPPMDEDGEEDEGPPRISSISGVSGGLYDDDNDDGDGMMTPSLRLKREKDSLSLSSKSGGRKGKKVSGRVSCGRHNNVEIDGVVDPRRLWVLREMFGIDN